MVNQWGVIDPCEEVIYKAVSATNYNGTATVSLGEHEGRWYVAVSYSIGNGGMGSAPSITHCRWSEKRGIPQHYSTRQEALDQGIIELTEQIEKLAGGNVFDLAHQSTDQGVKQAKEILIKLNSSRQLTLF